MENKQEYWRTKHTGRVASLYQAQGDANNLKKQHSEEAESGERTYIKVAERIAVLRNAVGIRRGIMLSWRAKSYQYGLTYMTDITEYKKFYDVILDSGDALLIDTIPYKDCPVLFAPIIAVDVPEEPPFDVPFDAFILGIVCVESPIGNEEYYLNILPNRKAIAQNSAMYVNEGGMRNWEVADSLHYMYTHIIERQGTTSFNYGDWQRTGLPRVYNVKKEDE